MIDIERKTCVAFPSGLDGIIKERFDVQSISKIDWSGDGKYHTKFKAHGLKAKAIRLFVEGFMAGNRELTKRLSECKSGHP